MIATHSVLDVDRGHVLRQMWVTFLLGSCALVAAGCATPMPNIIESLHDDPPNRSIAISGGSFPLGQGPYTVELGTFPCSTRPTGIRTVSLDHASAGIRLDRWGVENHRFDIPDSAIGPGVTLGRAGVFTSRVVTRICGRDDQYSRIGIEVERTKPGTQSFLGLRITYVSDGRSKTSFLWEQYRMTEPTSARH